MIYDRPTPTWGPDIKITDISSGLIYARRHKATSYSVHRRAFVKGTVIVARRLLMSQFLSTVTRKMIFRLSQKVQFCLETMQHDFTSSLMKSLKATDSIN